MRISLICLLPLSLLVISCRSGEPLLDRCPAGGSACARAFPDPSQRLDPEDRFEDRLAYIEKAVQGKRSFEEIIDGLNTEDVRKTTMQIQGLLRVYERMEGSKKDLKIIEEIRVSVKALEDAIGGLQRAEDLFKRSRAGGARPEILAVLEKNVIRQRETMTESLKDADWLPHPQQRIAAIREGLREYDFKKAKKDQRRQLKAMIDLIGDMRDANSKLGPHFKHKKFTHKEMELGVHTLRRNIRWVAATVQASDGLFAYDHASMHGPESKALEAEFGQNKYEKLDPPMKGAVAISRYDILLLLKYIKRLGDLKDFKETQFDLADILYREGFAKTRREAEESALTVMRAKFGDVDVEKEGRALYEDYVRKDPLRDLRKNLKVELEKLKDEES